VDATAPLLTLLEPAAGVTRGRAGALQVRVRLDEEESGLDVTSVTANGVPLTTRLIPGSAPPAFEAQGALPFPEGTHEIEVVARDAVGNEGALTLTYQRDLTPPAATLVSPAAGEGAHGVEAVLVEASDDASGVQGVRVNGVTATRVGGLWVSDPVTLSPALSPAAPALSVEVTDLAGNAVALPPAPVALPPFALRPPLRSGLPSEEGGVEEVGALLWGRWRGGALGALTLTTLAADAAGAPGVVGLSAAGAGLLSPAPPAARWALAAEPALPAAAALAGARAVSLGGALALVGLTPPTPPALTPALRAWSSSAAQGGRLAERPLAATPLTADALHAHDVNGDGAHDLITFTAGLQPRLFRQGADGQLSFDNNGLTARGLRQGADGQLSFDNNGLTARGLTGLTDPAGGRARLWSVDVNGDSLPDVVQQDGAQPGTGAPVGAKLWVASLVTAGGAYSYTSDPSFPPQPLSGLARLDWDAEGEEQSGAPRLDLLAWEGAALRRYAPLANGGWRVDELGALPGAVRGGVAVDLDGDGAQELLLYGAWGMQARDARGEAHAALTPALAPVDSVTPADVDEDGDEDLIVVSGGDVWLALANGAAARPAGLSAVRLRPRRAAAADALGVTVLVDEDGDFSFERVVEARPFGDTLIPFSGAGVVNLQVVFPDRGAPLANEAPLSTPKGATVDALEPAQ